MFGGHQVRVPYFDWEELREKHGEVIRRFENSIQKAEERGFELSTGAMEILLVPLMEQALAGRKIDFRELERSLDAIAKEAAQNPHPMDQGKEHRTSLSVLKAIAARWCNIPPICGPTDDT
jgi:hypothetical protein